MPTIDEVQPRCRFVGEDGGVRGASALPPDFAKCGGSRRMVEALPRLRLSQSVLRRDGGEREGEWERAGGARDEPVAEPAHLRRGPARRSVMGL